VVGEGSSGYKRDPYARELANDPAEPFPVCSAVVRSANAIHGMTSEKDGAGFRAPEFSDMVVYQLHIGTYAPKCPGGRRRFSMWWRRLSTWWSWGINAGAAAAGV